MTVPTHINRQCEDLSELLGNTCLPCVCDPSDDSINKQMASIYASVFQTDAVAALETIAEAIETNSTNLKTLGPDRIAFAVPLQHSGSKRWFAVGRSWTTDSASFRRLVYVATEASKRRYESDQLQSSLEFAETNIKTSIQEKNWIRELSAYSQDRGRVHPSALTNRILTQLGQIIHAEAVAVVPNEDFAHEDVTLRPAIFGLPNWQLEDCHVLLEHAGTAASGDLNVQNGRNFELINGTCKSCIIVQIGTAMPLGYLVAINRRISSGSQNRRATDIQFTAADASMLNEAATFFESEAIQRHAMGESERLVIGTLRSMSSAIEARDPYTRGHSERVARLSYILAKKMNISHEKCREIYVSGVLHDIGKIGIPDHVLMKPGRLEAEEIAIIQKHPIIGHHILSGIQRLEFALPGVLYHHEFWNGKGYPHQLAGEDIPLMARVLAVADSFDAMTSSRPYRSAMLVESACDVISKGAGHQWDPNVCHAFEDWVADREVFTDQEDPMGLLLTEMDFQADYASSTVPQETAA